MARANFKHYGLMVAEVSHLHLWTPENIHDHVTFENYEVYEKAKEKRRGCFYAIAHFGNWELLAHALVGRPSMPSFAPWTTPCWMITSSACAPRRETGSSTRSAGG